jgi:hypothetical protein
MCRVVADGCDVWMAELTRVSLASVCRPPVAIVKHLIDVHAALGTAVCIPDCLLVMGRFCGTFLLKVRLGVCRFVFARVCLADVFFFFAACK